MASNSVETDIHNSSPFYCLEIVQNLNKLPIQEDEITNWFKNICNNTAKFILNIDYKTYQTKEDLQTLLLPLCQILTYLKLLCNIFVKEKSVGEPFVEARRFCQKHMVKCFSAISEANVNKSIKHTDNFVLCMDLALDKVEKMIICKNDPKNAFNETKCIIEEVLSHAMSIAQVALVEDQKIIHGASQVVLEGLNTLKEEVNKEEENTSMLQFFADICTNNLCALERKVNTAVLKLSLFIFSEDSHPLKYIELFCLNKENTTSDELDMLIADFDLHVDRIMQIGLFAISCSSSTKICVRIKTCLASLEALESELVPALTAVLADYSNKNSALLLKKHWIDEANKLKHFIFLIIDPFAFCQICYEELKENVGSMLDLIENHDYTKFKSCVGKVIAQSKVMQEFIECIMTAGEADSKTVNEELFSNYKKVIHEIKCSKEFLLKKNEILDKDIFRVQKRCKVLLTILKQVWQCFAVKDRGMDATDSNSDYYAKNDYVPIQNRFLDHLIEKGKDILQDRSILYKTKNKTFKNISNQNISLSYNGEHTNKSRIINMRKLSFADSLLQNNDITDLDITAILSELTGLSKQ